MRQSAANRTNTKQNQQPHPANTPRDHAAKGEQPHGIHNHMRPACVEKSVGDQRPRRLTRMLLEIRGEDMVESSKVRLRCKLFKRRDGSETYPGPAREFGRDETEIQRNRQCVISIEHGYVKMDAKHRQTQTNHSA